MTIADLQDKSLAGLDIQPHPMIAEWDAKAERIETPLTEGRIVWRKWGSGPPLVFFHGGSGSWTHWIRNIPVLSRDYTVYAVDLPGMGDSDPFTGKDLELLPGETSDFREPLDPAWQPAPIEMAALSRILAGALEAMIPNEKINLVGFSFGGMTAANVTARIPHRIRRLVLSGAAGLVLRDPKMPPLGHLAVRFDRSRARQGAAPERRPAHAARSGIDRRSRGEHPDAQRPAHAVAQAAAAFHDDRGAGEGQAQPCGDLGPVRLRLGLEGGRDPPDLPPA